jgi:GNAT superfamily N-acetyltransferase
MITYQEETFEQVIEEIKPLLEDHWEEIALHKDSIKLNPDYGRYEELFKTGKMRIVTARDDSKLVGYCIMLLYHHIHYKDQFMAMDDIFFIAKEYRKGLTGVKLFIKTEEIIKQYGVTKLSMNVKVHQDVGAIFERLGYKETERMFTKKIGD